METEGLLCIEIVLGAMRFSWGREFKQTCFYPERQALVFSKTGLKAGRHVLKIEWTGKIHTGAKTATRINVDSLTVK